MNENPEVFLPMWLFKGTDFKDLDFDYPQGTILNFGKFGKNGLKILKRVQLTKEGWKEIK